MSQVDVVLGAFYGDEGKGAIADYLLHRGNYGAVVRFQGGNNAGHTLLVDGQTYKLHILPCGVINESALAVVGNGTVVDPEILLEEVAGLNSLSISCDNLRISDTAHVIMPYHRALDYIQEARRLAEDKIGSTCRGITPAYSDKINRRGIRIQDLLEPEVLRKKIEAVLDGETGKAIAEALRSLELPEEALPFLEKSLDPRLVQHTLDLGQQIAPWVCDSNALLWGLLDSGQEILCEGAQGVFLDIDYGSYPFVTSSSIVPGAVNTGAGIAPQDIRHVYGVLKAFGTRIDTVGPFPTWERSETADLIIERGGEFGTTTGRRRRFGWLDLVAARYAARLSGIDRLVVTKIDGLSDIEEIPVAVAYEIDGKQTKQYPSSMQKLARARPVYKTLPGWRGDISGARSLEDLPAEARDYLELISDVVGVEIAGVGVGPAREETIWLV